MWFTLHFKEILNATYLWWSADIGKTIIYIVKLAFDDNNNNKINNEIMKSGSIIYLFSK